ncbi:phospholipase D-like domain-containing protein [Halomarina halobia]|uniref:Phospholipase D-like domain-containing protein n=1 Tax=Halomarina halobia TaxID=3033386 RepID=A0ABD6ACJ5_9EURY|nr:phospholipase D-like domain-containing protein [Halomarina sp. PSR21]
MRRVVLVRLIVVLGLLVAASPQATAALVDSGQQGATSAGNATLDGNATGGPDRHPRLVGVYPNPVAADDAGEFVVLDAPAGTRLGTYRLADDETAVALPNATVGGRVVLTPVPERTRRLVDDRIVAVDALPRLANAGEPLRLSRDGAVVDALGYRDAPEGELYVRRVGRFRPLGATDRPVVASGPANATAFLLPDAPEVPTRVLAGAEERILLAGYTFTSDRVADELVRAHRRGVRVAVLVEGDPVGGTTTAQARALDRLVAAGIAVRAVDGPRARYAYHHAKYAVADDRALVLTENWKPSGAGGRSSRGWGVVVRDARTAAALAETFRADAGWLDARPWGTVRRNLTLVNESVAAGDYPRRIEPERLRVERVRVLAAPDNAERALRGVLGNATRSIDVVQVSLGGPDGPLAGAAIAAARRGVRVRVLLSGAWYVREENAALAERLNALADEEGIPLSARLADPRGRFEKVHAKGVVVDDRLAVVGSLNWNAHAARENREVALVLEGEAVGGYYARAFEADWHASASGDGREPRVPIGLLAGIAAAAAATAALGRRIEFEEGGGSDRY